jgi:hypothetical protein
MPSLVLLGHFPEVELHPDERGTLWVAVIFKSVRENKSESVIVGTLDDGLEQVVVSHGWPGSSLWTTPSNSMMHPGPAR